MLKIYKRFRFSNNSLIELYLKINDVKNERSKFSKH